MPDWWFPDDGLIPVSRNIGTEHCRTGAGKPDAGLMPVSGIIQQGHHVIDVKGLIRVRHQLRNAGIHGQEHCEQARAGECITSKVLHLRVRQPVQRQELLDGEGLETQRLVAQQDSVGLRRHVLADGHVANQKVLAAGRERVQHHGRGRRRHAHTVDPLRGVNGDRIGDLQYTIYNILYMACFNM